MTESTIVLQGTIEGVDWSENPHLVSFRVHKALRGDAPQASGGLCKAKCYVDDPDRMYLPDCEPLVGTFHVEKGTPAEIYLSVREGQLWIDYVHPMLSFSDSPEPVGAPAVPFRSILHASKEDKIWDRIRNSRIVVQATLVKLELVESEYAPSLAELRVLRTVLGEEQQEELRVLVQAVAENADTRYWKLDPNRGPFVEKIPAEGTLCEVYLSLYGDKLWVSHFHPIQELSEKPQAPAIYAVGTDFLLRNEAKQDEHYLHDYFVVGREKGDMILGSDPQVSGRHCRFEIEGNQATVEDLESRNGTLLNGARLREALKARISDGDKIQVGDTVFTVIVRARRRG